MPRVARLAPLLSFLCVPTVALAQKDGAAKAEGTVSGIVTDRPGKTLMLKADGDETATAHAIPDGLDKKATDALKGAFTVNRFKVTYRTVGDARQLVGIAKLPTKQAGTVTGTVPSANGWWVEVKPKDAPADGYAANFPTDKHRDVMDKIKSLEKGDTVTIRFTTDGERHRIQSIQKVASKK